jgi:hypothetical protein
MSNAAASSPPATAFTVNYGGRLGARRRSISPADVAYEKYRVDWHEGLRPMATILGDVT